MTTTVETKGSFRLQLQRNQADFADLLATWDQMSPGQRKVCVAEIRHRMDSLQNMHADLVHSNTQRMSFLECVFLGLILLCPILYRAYMVGGGFDPIEL
jgi:hypothetical protein